MTDIYADALEALAPIFRAAGGKTVTELKSVYHDKLTRTGMSDEAFADEDEAIGQAAVILRSTRSALLDIQAKMTTQANKADIGDMLAWLPEDVTKWAETARRVLKEERDGA